MGKFTSKYIRLLPVFIQKRFEVNEKPIYSSKKLEIQLVVFMIMHTRSSGRDHFK